VDELNDIQEDADLDKTIEKCDGHRSNQDLCVGVDYERYQHYLEDSDLSDGDKQKVVQALWDIIVNFVDLGIGVHPIQQTGTEITDSTNESLEAFQTAFEAVANEKSDQQLEGVDA